jgi:hypothetical protein
MRARVRPAAIKRQVISATMTGRLFTLEVVDPLSAAPILPG